jgi:ATP-dependent Lhr-like helicase
MTTSPPSGSDTGHRPSTAGEPTSASVPLLHPKVQQWLWRKGWTSLRDAQEAAIPVLLEAERDVIISAATAGGKTEAAFLPICSKLAGDATPGVRALYVGPLKALINDQFERLEDLCTDLEIPVHRWHGDVAATKKSRVFDEPRGILLITPESLEGLFVRRGTEIKRVFGALEYVVIDELHAFINTERGRQLQSLLRRLELTIRHRVIRVGLSATLGDMDLAKDHLRPEGSDRVELIQSSADGQELKLQLRGYRVLLRDRPADDPAGSDTEGEVSDDVAAIAKDVYRALRGTSNLIFANRRADVEQYADLLRRQCERDRVPNEFWPHHGSLSKELRESLEARLKERSRPINAVCTSTLELGIDIGSVTSIAQIGTPFTVASLRQRLGRSGRRGGPAVLRLYVSELEITEKTPTIDTLRLDLVQSIAMLNLLLRGWCEPPREGALHLSTLIQQVLSQVAQFGGLTAADAWASLCQHGPFWGVDTRMFAQLLRALGQADLIVQMDDGTLLLGEKGERIVNHFSFYAAFETPEEYRIVHGGRLLGSMPMNSMVDERYYLIFAGRRWKVTAVDEDKKTIHVQPAKGGRLPSFTSRLGGTLHEEIRGEMLAVYSSGDVPAYLDPTARDLLMEARTNFVQLSLHDRLVIPEGRGSLVFCWHSDDVVGTLAALLARQGLKVDVPHGPVIPLAEAPPAETIAQLRSLSVLQPPQPDILAHDVPAKRREKHDVWLDEDLLCAEYASRYLAVRNAIEAARAISGSSAS